MSNFPMNKKCRTCLYHLGVIKFVVCPCFKCKVYGGNSPPITAVTLLKDGVEKNKKN